MNSIEKNTVNASEKGINVEERKKDLAAARNLAGTLLLGATARAITVHRLSQKINKQENATVAGGIVRSFSNVGLCLQTARFGCDFVTSLAEQIDRIFGVATPKEEPVAEEETVEVAVEEPVEEAVPAFAEVAPEVVAEPVEDENGDDDADEDEDTPIPGISGLDLTYIDVMEEPEKYQEMLAEEAKGECQLVTRYRRSFRSRLIQSQGNVQDYYNEIKNLLLSYKGVKARTSWAQESFNRGRNYVAKVNAKTKTLYLYLAIDPATLTDSKYEVVDVSAKKKYAAVPTLIKIKGDRKFKYALELIKQVCEEQMVLPPVKNFEPTDYRMPYQSTEELVQAGTIRQLVASIPVVKE